MLRESVEQSGESIDLDGLADPSRTDIKGVPNSNELLQFATTCLGDDLSAISAARQALVETMGTDAMVDAAGVISNFQRMDRIADSTGIPSEAPTLVMSEDLCEQLGIDKFVSAANTDKPSFLKRLLIKFVAVPQFRKMIRESGNSK
jgi:hypothetical protein